MSCVQHTTHCECCQSVVRGENAPAGVRQGCQATMADAAWWGGGGAPSTSVLPTVPPSRPRNAPPHKAVAPATRRLPPAHCPLTPSPLPFLQHTHTRRTVPNRHSPPTVIPAQAGIQGGARPCAAHHLPPATPQPSPHMAVAPATREGGNPGWGAALRSPSPTPRHPATLPPHGRRASDPRRRESRVGRGPAQPITYPPPPRNPPPTWPSRQRPAKAGIQGGARPCAAHHLPPATPQPSPHMAVAPATREGGNPGWGAALRSPSPTPRHPATLPPHGRRASDPRRRESRVGRGPAQPITYPPATPQPSPHMAVAPATRESGNPGWRQACAPPQSRRAATRVKPRRRCQGGSPAKEQSTRKAMPKLPGVSTKQTIDPLCTFQVQKAQKKEQTIHRTITIKRPAAGGDPLRRRRIAATPSPHGALQCPKPQPPDTGRSLERYEHPSTAIPPEAPPSRPRNPHLHGRRASDPLQFGGVSCSGRRPCWRRCIRTSRSSS